MPEITLRGNHDQPRPTEDLAGLLSGKRALAGTDLPEERATKRKMCVLPHTRVTQAITRVTQGIGFQRYDWLVSLAVTNFSFPDVFAKYELLDFL